MPHAYSSAYKSTVASVSAPEAPLVLLEITHPTLTSPIRVVNDTQDITCNQNFYIAYPFRFIPPDDFENQSPKATLSIDNTGKDLMYWIETSGGGSGSLVKIMSIMRSQPDLIEWDITLELSNVRASMAEISADLGYENLYSRSAVSKKYRPDNSSGLF